MMDSSPNDYEPEDQNGIEDAIKKILKAGGMSPEQAEEFCQCDQPDPEVSLKSQAKAQQIIQSTNAHNNVKEMFEFIAQASGGNYSFQMRASAFCMDLLEGFQDLVDSEKHVGSASFRQILAAYVSNIISAHSKKIISAINSGEDQGSISALNKLTEINKPRTDEEIKKLEEGLQ